MRHKHQNINLDTHRIQASDFGLTARPGVALENGMKPGERRAGNVLSGIFSAMLIALCTAFPVVFIQDRESVYESRAVIYVDASHDVTGLQGASSADAASKALSYAASAVNGQKLLESVVQDLDLQQSLDRITPEANAFTGSFAADDGRGDVYSPQGKDAAKLRNLISIEPDVQTSVMTIAVRSLNARASAEIANTIVEHLKAMNTVGQSESHTSVETLEAKVKQTEAALLDYQRANPVAQPDTSLQNEVSDIRSRLEDARHKGDLLNKATAASALAGQFPAELASARLDTLLQDYSLVKLDLSQMSLKLGPRHPDFLAATKRADDIKASIGNEVTRIAKSVKKGLDDLTAAEKLVTRQAAEQAEPVQPAAGDQLPLLQKAVEEARSAYAAALLEPSPQAENTQFIRTVSRAVPAVQPLAAPLADMLLPAGFGGLVGMVILGLVRTLRPYVTRREQGFGLPFNEGHPLPATLGNTIQEDLDDLVLAELSLASIPPKPASAPGKPPQSAPVSLLQGPDVEEEQASLEDMVRRLSSLHEQLQSLERDFQNDMNTRNLPSTCRNAHAVLIAGNANARADQPLKSARRPADDSSDLTLDDVRHAMRSIKQRVEIYGRKQA